MSFHWRALFTSPGGLVRTRRGRRVLLAVVVLVGVYAIAGFFVLPVVLRGAIERIAREHYDVAAGIRELEINPFLLALEARDVSASETSGAPLFGATRLVIDLDAASFWHRGWIISSIHTEGEWIELARERDGRFNLQRVFGSRAADGNASMPHVLLRRLDIERGSFHYSDQDSANPASVALQGMDVTLTDLSTRQGKSGRFSLAARMPDGTQLAGEGELALSPFASSGVLRVKDMTPQSAWEFIDAQMRMAQPSGRVSAVLNYRMSTAAGFALELDAPEFAVSALTLRKRDDAAPLLSLARITLPGSRFDLARRTVTIPALGIAEGAIAVGVDASGVVDWATLSADTPAQPSAAPWQVDIGQLRVEGVDFAMTDASRQAPFGIVFSNAQAQLSLQARLGGTDTAIRIANGSLGVADAALTTGATPEPIARAAALRLDALEADIAQHRVNAARLTLDGVDTRLSRAADGSIRELTLISTRNPDNPLPITSAALAWQIAVDEVGVTGLNAQLSDAATAPPVAYAIRGGTLTIHNLSNAGAQPIRIAASLPVEQGGDIAVNGDARTDGSTGTLKLRIKDLALLPLAPALDRYTTLALRAGALSGQSDLSWKGGANSTTALLATGDFDVNGLRMDESGTGDTLFSARRLAANGVEFGLGPDHLAIRDLRLDTPTLKLVVFKDRSTNLGAIVRDAPQGETAGSATEADEPFPVMLERTRVRDATLDFADFSLVLPFATRIEALKGSASEISSGATSRASLKFTGSVGQFGEAQIDGLVSPFDPARFTDIEVSFRNIALNSLSPYSATFAGRAIDAGDIDLDLEYKVANGALAGDNRIVLQDLKLGARVDSPSAEDLPLDLAIALLTDANGRIELSLPVSGHVGDPQYSYGSVVRRALGNILRGVAAAPFRALGSLFGGNKGDDAGSLRFRSGSAELLPSERERIGKLVTALAERPQVAVSVPLGIEPKRDGYAIRRLAVRRAIADILGTELEPDEDPGPVSYVNAKSQHALEKLLEHREGKDASATFASNYAKQVGREPERVNPALALFGHASDDAEFYRALYLYLVNSTPLPQEQLDALARARADAVAAECGARGFAGDRVRIGTVRTLQQARPSGVLLPLDLTSR